MGLVKWCLSRLGRGAQGRANKDADTCYSWWIGASLKILGGYGLFDSAPTRDFNLCCQYKRGGVCKYIGHPPDIMHSYYGLSGLSLMGYADLLPLDPALSITKRAAGDLPSAGLPELVAAGSLL
eukprot:gnl/Hemi2/1328_TR468_c0_g1_i1.p2 gnl/Hemi2/1328_TR468_c0_g1~~gnl/Hemi2/1328_TR468_c0_g1_i1.p2  ORF type:complete len:124 (+),score=27.40 gnl/Hemi2/1328_TR468_c0_g1_i1:163-534(+)